MADKRVLLVLGGIYHDFEGFAAWAKPLLAENGYLLEATYDLDMLTRLDGSDYDVVMIYTSLSTHREGQDDTHPEFFSDEQTKALADWVSSGGALLPVHAATVAGRENLRQKRLMGAVFIEHPPQHTFTVYPLLPEHALTAGVGAFSVTDEFYIQEYEPSLDVHMVAIDRGKAYPMVWTKAEGEGRVAYVAMGHDQGVWDLAPYGKLMIQALDWLTS